MSNKNSYGLFRLIVVCGFIHVCLGGTFRYLRQLRQYLDSPCPNIFEYRFENQNLVGYIQIDCPRDNSVVQLNVELSVGNVVQGYNGNIELVYPKDVVINKIIQRQPITYKLNFPSWTRIRPQITKIAVNGEVICTGPKIPMNFVEVLTTINLQHILRVNIAPLISASKDVVTPELINPQIISPQNDKTLDVYVANLYPEESQGEEDIVKTRQNILGSSNPFIRKNNPYNFSPKTPTTSPIEFYYKSVTENDSTNYANNPFLNNVSSTKSPNQKPISNDVAKPVHTNDVRVSFPTERKDSTSKSEKTRKRTTGTTSGDTFTDSPAQYSDICGLAADSNQLVVNGYKVTKGAFPWLVALFHVSNGQLTYECSGSLITKQHVVTAAHCVRRDSHQLSPDKIFLMLGKLNIQKWPPSSEEKMVGARRIISHPSFQAKTVISADADIAIIILNDVIEFTNTIRPLCLWNEDDKLEKVVNQTGTVVGWGKNEHGDISAEPKLVRLPIVTQEQCKNSDYSFPFIISEHTFCAGYKNGSGPCNGDSGSGFIMKRSGRWCLKGIVSTSLGDGVDRTCNVNNYIVFTDASKYKNWILDIIK